MKSTVICFDSVVGLGVEVIGDTMYAVGGHSGTIYLSTVQRYNPYSDTWWQDHAMSTCRCSFGLAAIFRHPASGEESPRLLKTDPS